MGKMGWEQSSKGNHRVTGNGVCNFTRLMTYTFLFLLAIYLTYTFNLLATESNPSSCDCTDASTTTTRPTNTNTSQPPPQRRIELAVSDDPVLPPWGRTDLKNIVFGIGASSGLWKNRKEYIKLWWRQRRMRGAVWIDKPVRTNRSEGLPPIRVSGDTSKFKYTNKQGPRSAIRISRIVAETLRLTPTEDVHWFVLGDDDTVFVTDNLVRVLSKYDHRQFYYIGGQSESHLQNIFFSYNMAYGGGGFAISYPLARALTGIQDQCIQRYPALYGSDERVQACMAELGVPITKEPGFHQYDVFGNLFGLLAAHPVTPFISIHHLDVAEPVFPNTTRLVALRRLLEPTRLDSAAILQQSICYDKDRQWTISVSWGYTVQIFRGIFSPREMEMPSRTFLNWYPRADFTAYAFNTRPVSRHPCQKPFVFYYDRMRLYRRGSNMTVTTYQKAAVPAPECRWKMASPEVVRTIEVYKRADPNMWSKSPRRNCCRIGKSGKTDALSINVGECRDGETSIT